MIKLRTQQIIIDIPTINSEPWILIKIQKIQIDSNNNIISTIDRWGTINKKLSDVALNITNYFEAVPVIASDQISIYGISDAIKETAISWIIEKYGGIVNNSGEVIL